MKYFGLDLSWIKWLWNPAQTRYKECRTMLNLWDKTFDVKSNIFPYRCNKFISWLVII